MKMKIYLAGSLKRQSYLREVIKPMIERAGHEVTSSWLDGKHSPGIESQRMWGRKNAHDVKRSDCIIIYPLDSSSGGLHVELGLALGLTKHIMVVGDRPNCFFHLTEICFFETTVELWESLNELAKEEKL